MKFNISVNSTTEMISKKDVENLYKEQRIKEQNINFVRDLFEKENYTPVRYNNWSATFSVNPLKKRTKEEDIISEIYALLKSIINLNGGNIVNSSSENIRAIINDNISLSEVIDIEDVCYHNAIGSVNQDNKLSSLSVIVDKFICKKGTNEKEVFLDLAEWKANVIAKTSTLSEKEISNKIQLIIYNTALKEGISKFCSMNEEEVQRLFNKNLNKKELIIRSVEFVQPQSTNQEQFGL